MKHEIQNGERYTRLIPKSKNEKTNLPTGTTDLGLRQMRKWSKQYQWQTKALAKELKGQNIAQTISNIHSFLYNHIQYTADGALQKLRSPANSWANRQDGIDCKSFAIAGITILNNLGITAYFRKIKQPFFKPDQWTHVYVVVPKDQKTKSATNTYVLDATLAINQEVPYKEKKDLLMEANLKYQGLNGVATQPSATTDVMANFYAFLQALINDGYAPNAVKTLQNRVETIINAGQEPYFKFKPTGVFVNDTYIAIPKNLGLNGLFDNAPSFTSKFNSTNFGNSNFGSKPNFNVKVPSHSFGGSSSSTNATGKFTSKFNSAFGAASGLDLNKPLLQTGASMALTEAGIPFADQIVGAFSSIFKSFGRSALNTTSQTAEIEQKQAAIDASLATINKNNINQVINEVSRYIQFQIDYFKNTNNRRKWSPKTQAALKLNASSFETYKQQKFIPLLNSLQSQGYSIKQSTKTESQNYLTSLYRGSDTAKTSYNITYPIYQITPPNNSRNSRNAITNNQNTSNPIKVSTASMGWFAALAVAGIALSGGIKTKKSS